ncbi:hypothetical protein PO124_19090 [Bacillus licheniformis]|nr:hypothetical protein [Bacillus licheniformis]
MDLEYGARPLRRAIQNTWKTGCQKSS